MPQSRFSTPSTSSNESTADQKIQEHLAEIMSVIDRTTNMISTGSGSPQKADASLPLLQKCSSAHGKRPASFEESLHQAVRMERSSSAATDLGSWTIIEKQSENAKCKTEIRPISRRRERRVRFESSNNGSKLVSEDAHIVVEGGKESSRPETAQEGSNPSVINSRSSAINDNPVIRSDVSMARTCYIDNAADVDFDIETDIVRLATGSMSVALLADLGAQFMDSTPYTNIRYDDWIMV